MICHISWVHPLSPRHLRRPRCMSTTGAAGPTHASTAARPRAASIACRAALQGERG
jgi:hypothetical protein